MKKITTRLLTWLLLLSLLVSLVACGTGSTPEADPDPSEDPILLIENSDALPTLSLSSEIKNIILIIGDGMGPEQLRSGQLIENKTYGFTEWQSTTSNTNSLSEDGSFRVTDSAAASTAMATGTLTTNKRIGQDKDGNHLKTILDTAKELGKSTGIVTSDYLYGATPAGFSAHAENRDEKDAITRTQITSGINFLCGLRDAAFHLAYKDTMDKEGVYFASDLSKWDSIMASERAFLSVNIENKKSDSVKLSEATSLALEYLERDEDGFVLMVEQAKIDSYAHKNEIDGMVERVKSLNETVETVMAWVGDRTDTVVIVTADHETGDFSVSSDPEHDAHYTEGENTIYYCFGSEDHTDTRVPVYLFGITVDFASISKMSTAEEIKNTDIYRLMKAILKAR